MEFVQENKTWYSTRYVRYYFVWKIYQPLQNVISCFLGLAPFGFSFSFFPEKKKKVLMLNDLHELSSPVILEKQEKKNPSVACKPLKIGLTKYCVMSLK